MQFEGLVDYMDNDSREWKFNHWLLMTVPMKIACARGRSQCSSKIAVRLLDGVSPHSRDTATEGAISPPRNAPLEEGIGAMDVEECGRRHHICLSCGFFSRVLPRVGSS